MGAAQADYYINLSSYWGCLDTDGVTPLLPSVGDTATVQLIYAGANGVADEYASNLLWTDSFSDFNIVAGDDVLLYSATFTNTGGLYEEYAAGNYGTFDGAAYLGPNVYGRIWDTDKPGFGANCFVGAIYSANDKDSGAVPAPSPDVYDLNPAGNGASGVAMGMLIPEPTTIGLMGIAGMGMFLARRKTHR